MRYIKPISRPFPARAQANGNDDNEFGWVDFWYWWDFVLNVLIMATRGFGPKFL